ncbi:carboxypeptidase regulatory-like domain-containing protein [candidate division KSB1 bacterium]|nr:carboxypeptidase regulatory-like domain-containing protein [candidate division KSB1 bacterium]
MKNQYTNIFALFTILLCIFGTAAFAAHVVVMPDSVVLEPEHGIHFKAQIFDANGTATRLSLDQYTWSVVPKTLGEISDDGYFIAGKHPGKGKVLASIEINGTRYIGDADVWVGRLPAPQIELIIKPARAIVPPGDSLLYRAYAVTASGRSVQIDHLRWSVHPNTLGTINARGLFIANRTQMEGNVIAVAEIAGQIYKTEARLIVAEKPTGAIAGIVTSDDDGSPIPRAEIWAHRIGHIKWHRKGRTDENGQYLLNSLIPGLYVIRASAPHFIAEWHEDARQYIEAKPEQVASEDTITIDFGLSSGASIAGAVTADLDATPLQYAHVVAYLVVNPSIKHHALTAEDGTYIIDGLTSGTYAVYADKPGYYGEWFDDKKHHSQADLVTVEEPDQTGGIDFALEIANAITGAVTDAKDSTPLAGAHVYARNILSSAAVKIDAETRTNRNGEYVLQLKKPGSYLVYAGTDGYVGEFYKDAYTIQNAIPVEVDTNQHTTGIDFDLAMRGKMTGAVTDEVTGEPIVNALIEAFWEGPRNTSHRAYRTKTDSNGVYLLEDLLAGKYLVRSEARGYLPLYFKNATHPDEAIFVPVKDSTTTGDIDFLLNQGGSISGLVLAEKDSMPIANAKIVVKKVRSNLFKHTYSTDDGQFKIGGLPSSKYLVWAIARGYRPLFYKNVPDRRNATLVEVVAPNVSPDIDFLLPAVNLKEGVIAGCVTVEPTDATNLISAQPPEPIHGAWVVALPVNKGLPHWTVTHEDGTYKLTHLKSGKYIVAAWAFGYIGEFYDDVRNWKRATPVKVANNQVTEDIDFALEARSDGAYMISGTVISTENVPQGEVMLYASSDSGTSSFAFSDIDGSYTIDGLTPGTYKVEAVAVGFEPAFHGGLDASSATSVTVGETANASDINIEIPSVPTDVDAQDGVSQLPVAFDVHQNYPNPFNPTTEIHFQLPMKSRVSLKIYNMLGQEVRTLVDGIKEAGFLKVQWDGKNQAGLGVASGIYLYRFSAETADGQTFNKIMKMSLIR